MTLKSLCIHAHFYQPPREDPFTGLIPSEIGAEPYHNWNERIHAECYRPNAELRNFERISFNIGPTLYEWMTDYDPAVCRSIAAQDQANVLRHGVGNAIAQAYNHTILPLATCKDKETQITWGIVDFGHRLGRKPQGMWLPETAVDYETLMILEKYGIQYTILAPWQVESSNIDCTEPYLVDLPNGRTITVFIYHQALSSEVSFNPSWTINADAFVESEIQASFNPEKVLRGEDQLLIIASDGELYGHHQAFRDRFLAHLVNGASSQRGIELTYPALWLKSHPPRQHVRIRENTSWSCHHGLQRWQGECGCSPGDGRWKAYLREALDRLAAEMDDLYVETTKPLGIDPWILLNRYIFVMVGELPLESLVQEAAGRALKAEEIQRVGLMLEAQRHRQRMFTSCGWFFGDFSRLEPRNNLAYAAQAVWLTKQATGVNLAGQVSDNLRKVTSRRKGACGDRVFQRYLNKAKALA